MPRFGRFRRLVIALAVVSAFFIILITGLFLGVPPLVRHVAQGPLSQSLERPVSVGKTSFNPFTLTLDVQNVRIGDRGGEADNSARSADIGKGKGTGGSEGNDSGKGTDGGTVAGTPLAEIPAVHLQLSWASLRHLAPVVEALHLQSPHLSIVRTAPARFNISDLIDKALAPKAPSGKPAYFSVSNIQVEGGSVDFDDRVAKRTHKVDKLRIGIPFIANFPADTDVWVQPLIGAVVDGSPFGLSGRSQVFAPAGTSELHIKFDGLDLSKYVAYVPATLPFGVRSGSVSGDISVRFVKSSGTPQLHVSGHLGAADLAIDGADGAPLLGAGAMAVDLGDAQPLQGMYSFDSISAQAPVVSLTRDARGRWTALSRNREAAAGPRAEPAASHERTAAPSGEQAASRTEGATSPRAGQPANPLDLRIGKLTVADGRIKLTDHPGGATAHMQVAALDASLEHFATRAASTPAHFAIHGTLGEAGKFGADGTLALAAKQLKAGLTLQRIDLTAFRPYLVEATAADLEHGLLSASLPLTVDWSGNTPRIDAGQGTIGLDDGAIATRAGAQPQITLAHGEVAIASLDLTGHRAEFKAIALDGLTAHAARDAHGVIDIGPQAWRPGPVRQAAEKAAHTANPANPANPANTERAPGTDDTASTASDDATATANPASPSSAAGSRARDNAPAASPWHYAIGAIRLTHGAVDFSDATPAQPVHLHFGDVAASVDKFAGDLSRPLPVSVAGTFNQGGTFKLDGTVVAGEPSGKLHVHLHGIDVPTFQPYMGRSHYNAVLARGGLDMDGDARFTGKDGIWKGGFDGQAGVDDLRLVDTQTKHALAAWRSLHLEGLHARYDGKTPTVHIGTLALSQFYARAFLDANGQLNLKHLSADETGHVPQPPAPASAPSARAAASGAGAKAVIAIDQTVLDGGHLNFTDNFIRPNYTADLLDIAGTIGAFATASRAPTPIKLRGRIAPDGPVTITGSATPLDQPPALDLTVQARDILLPKLSPYSTKYAGYPIESGSLTVDLHYVLNNGQLHADNHLFINQLTLGKRSEQPGAGKLPLALAISLLKDSQGRIDVDIPVSGSLSDPDFSVAGLVWHAIGTLVRKVVTAPFSFLGGAKGNTHPDYVVFASGSAVLSADAEATLKPTVEAMKAHPQLASRLVGRADPVLDAAALRDAALARMVATAKAKDSTSNPTPAEIDKTVVAPAEYDQYLAKAYKQADFAKERNWVGLPRTLPPETMKRLLAANIRIGDDDLRALATARAKAVDDYLVGQQIDAARLTVAPPTLDTDSVPADQKTTRVDLTAQVQ